MEAKDLMVGDWVYFTYPTFPIPAIVEAISPREGSAEGYTFLLRYEGNEVCLARQGMVDPIPLTPKILEKNGFRYNDDPFAMGWKQYGMILYYRAVGRFGVSGLNDIQIDYVHELQHLLRLCGIDKGIVL